MVKSTLDIENLYLQVIGGVQRFTAITKMVYGSGMSRSAMLT